MANITVRNLDEDTKTYLAVIAAYNNRSMEEEARLALADHVSRKPETRNFAEIMRSLFGPEHGVDLEIPPRTSTREPPSFG